MNPLVDKPLLGDIPLYLADSTKSVEMAPNGIAIGVIELRGWQIHRLESDPTETSGRAAYLVRANYDFVIAPDVPAPDWAEIEFEFTTAGVVVLDALPRTQLQASPPTCYALNDQLNFVADAHDRPSRWPVGSPAASIPMPTLAPSIECSGIGGGYVRWHHSDEVRARSHTGYFVLLAPTECEAVSVVASGVYHVPIDPALRLRSTGRRDAFIVQLPPAARCFATGTATSTPLEPTAGTALVRKGSPRVFVSYAQESREHKDAVGNLCEFMIGLGIDVRYDRQGREFRRNWDRWINTEILRADYVVVVASPEYRAAAHGELPEGERLGVSFEYDRLVSLLHVYRTEWTRKILPVVLPGRSPEEIPLSFLPGTGDYYIIKGFTEAGARNLLRVLRNGRSEP
ncbi:toll/interleukin-1 receptor domain-containing protein [Nocardia brasiliensis]|uniref:toll/interleukin-1 receptor domain-containing protein n=1 Tax=Nocardia brasiliensis TaxID=37326 RepID=UPI002454D87A|nr:toll/interleukin-1 receptor domain-containing protein [Nocardia brasiliensis]